MQQCIKILLFLILNKAQHVSEDTPPIIRSLKLYKQPVVLHNIVEGCRTCFFFIFLYFQLDTLFFRLRTISAILFPLHVSGLIGPSSGGLNCTCSLWYSPPLQMSLSCGRSQRRPFSTAARQRRLQRRRIP